VSETHIALIAARDDSTKKVQWSGLAEAANSGYMLDDKINGCLSMVIKGWMTLSSDKLVGMVVATVVAFRRFKYRQLWFAP
jgi:hypothetical protein